MLVLLQLPHVSSFSTDHECENSGAELAARPTTLASETSLMQPVKPEKFMTLAGAGILPVSGLSTKALSANKHTVGTSGQFTPPRLLSQNMAGQLGKKYTLVSYGPAGGQRIGLSGVGGVGGLTRPPTSLVPDPGLQLPGILGHGERVQIPISDPSVGTAADLKRSTLSPTMRSLQAAYGIGSGVDKPSACTTNVTVDWMKQSALVSGLSSVAPPVLVRQYLANPAAFATEYTSKLAQQMIPYIASAKSLMASCFRPAEKSAYEQSHDVLRQMGTVSVADMPVCTGLLMGNPRYVVTARHCFTGLGSAANTATFWFQPVRSKDRFQVCAIAEPTALTAIKKNTIELDQVLVRVANTGIAAKPVLLAASKALLTTDDERGGNANAPTLLKNFSFLPLATILMPGEYKSGFAESAVDYCAAVRTMKGCFSHVCNAVAGGSGSPIFAAHSSAITLVGTHVGGSAEKGLNCKAATGTVTNSAVLINQGYSPDIFRTN